MSARAYFNMWNSNNKFNQHILSHPKYLVINLHNLPIGNDFVKKNPNQVATETIKNKTISFTNHTLHIHSFSHIRSFTHQSYTHLQFYTWKFNTSQFYTWQFNTSQFYTSQFCTSKFYRPVGPLPTITRPPPLNLLGIIYRFRPA